jgi:PAS domain S-box-containing protein
VSSNQNFHILIIDDNQTNLNILKHQLEHRGFYVTTKISGAEGLEFLQQETKPNLILLDLMMPEMDGHSVCQKIRSQFDASILPIIVITAKNQLDDFEKAFSYGVNDYIVKPINEIELHGRVLNYVRLREIQLLKEKINKQQKVEIANTAKEEQFKDIVENSPEAILIECKGQIAYINPAGMKLLGLRADHFDRVLGKPILDFVHPKSKEHVTKRIQKIISQRITSPFEEERLQIPGKNIEVEIAGTYVRYQGKSAIEIWLRDVTEKNRQIRIREFRLKIEKLIAAISGEFIRTPVDHFDDVVNQSLQKLCELAKVDRAYILLSKKDWSSFTKKWLWSGKEEFRFNRLKMHHLPWSPQELQIREFLIALSPDIQQAKKKASSFFHPELKSFVAIPLIQHNEIYGIIGFDYSRTHDWDEEDIALFKLIGEVFAGALIRRNMEKELVKAKEEAEYLTKLKSEFLANMSHEIRTPMNGVIGLTRVLLESNLLPRQHELAETIKSSGSTLLRIINDVLDFSKIEAGKLELDSEPFDIRRCIDQTVDLFSGKAREKDIEIISWFDGNVPSFLNGDEGRLQQVISNLLSNAIKFTPKGNITIRVKTIKQHWGKIKLEFSIQDSGMGISEEKQNLLFQSFSQGDLKTVKKYGGTGLGLSICKKIIELMEGKIWIESEPEKGANFIFQIKLDFTPFDEKEFLTKNHQDFQHLRILVVIHEPQFAKMISYHCEFWGMKVTTFSSPVDVINHLEKYRDFDLAIIDHRFLELQGYDVAYEVQQRVHSISILLMTIVGKGNFKRKDPYKIISNYLPKPVKQEFLFHTLKNIIIGGSSEPIQPTQRDQSFKDLAERIPLQILLAEDNEINQKTAILTLELMGYHADVVGDGDEVLTALNQKKYDLILMDMEMPKMNGISATKEIVRRYGRKRPKIVAMTAHTRDEDRSLCLQAGMDEFISKPISPENAQEHIEYLFNEKALPKQVKVFIGNVSPNQNAIIDLSFIKNITDDEELINELLEIFWEQLDSTVKTLRTLTDAKDFRNIQELAHKLKGSSINLGAVQIANACRRIERSGREANLSNMNELIRSLEESIGETKEEVETNFSKN